MIPTKAYVFLAVASTLCVAVFLGYTHYQGLLRDNATLTENNAKLDMAVETEQATSDVLRNNIKGWEAAVNGYENHIALIEQSEYKAQAEVRRLNDTFAKHDLTKLALAKPRLIERRINAGTQRVFDILKCETSPGRCTSSGTPTNTAGTASPSPTKAH